ncbi:MAG: hypothetical protein ACRYGG_20780 [Janthinobacterium lividum]
MDSSFICAAVACITAVVALLFSLYAIAASARCGHCIQVLQESTLVTAAQLGEQAADLDSAHHLCRDRLRFSNATRESLAYSDKQAASRFARYDEKIAKIASKQAQINQMTSAYDQLPDQFAALSKKLDGMFKEQTSLHKRISTLKRGRHGRQDEADGSHLE